MTPSTATPSTSRGGTGLLSRADGLPVDSLRYVDPVLEQPERLVECNRLLGILDEIGHDAPLPTWPRDV